MKIGWIAVAVPLLLAGCARPRPDAPAPDAALVGTAWTVERIDDLAADRAVTTLRFEEGRASGRGGCNQYSGYLQAAGEALRISEIRSTRMACALPAMEQERRFLAALAAVRVARREGARLTLLDEVGRARLVLGPLPPPGGAASGRRARLFDCADGSALAITEVDDDAIEAWLADGRYRLPRVPATSGARYSDGSVSVWSHGPEVLVERDGRSWRCAESQVRTPR